MPLTTFIINIINPKFVKYSRPLLLAIPVGVCMVVGVIVMSLVNKNIESCTTNRVQFFGSLDEQMTFIAEAKSAVPEGLGHAKICILNIKALVETTGTHRLGGRKQVAQEPCNLREEDLEAAVIEWCEGADTPDRVYNNPTDPMICHRNSQDKNGIMLPYTVDYRHTVCTSPSYTVAIGAAVGYSDKIELVFTVIFIALFTSTGLVAVKEGTRFGAISTTPNK